MKVFTYNNISTGRKNETLHAKSKEEVIKIYSEMGQQIEITDVFDPDKFLDSTEQIPVDTVAGTSLPPIKNEPVKEIKPTFFETNGIKFKIEDAVVYKKDWIEIENKADYKVVRELKGKSDSVRETNITEDVKIYRNDWVKVEHKDEE